MAENFNLHGLIWVTGLSGAGKTTFSHILQQQLIKKTGCRPVLLDGDVLRKIFNQENTHAPADRHALARQYAALSSLLVSQKQCVICSTISMFQNVRDDNRSFNPHYCEVFIDVDDKIRHDRHDTGSLNKNDIEAEDSVFQMPQNPDIVLKNPSLKDMEDACDEVLAFIKSKWV